MKEPDYDVAVVGGGIQGVGVAQAAAAAGYSVLLLEERELAAGTSCRSSKLIHGGLRYLETGELGLVRESLAERELLLLNAPKLVRLVPFHLPIYRETSRRPWQIRAGLALYALLGNLRSNARFEEVPPDSWSGLDGLSTTGLQRVFRYFDGQTDDRALTRAVMRSALELGAELACPARFLAAKRTTAGWSIRYLVGDLARISHQHRREDATGRVGQGVATDPTKGSRVRSRSERGEGSLWIPRSGTDLVGQRGSDPSQQRSPARPGASAVDAGERSGLEHSVQVAALVNAAGPWVEEVRARVRPMPPGAAIELVQGAHIELPGLIARGVYYVEAPRDRRAVFTMPWKGHTLVGTTETPYRGDPAAVRALDAEVEYLIETFHHYFPDAKAEVLDAWAGLRVLPAGGGAAFRRPRDVRLIADDREKPRTVAIYGGKLTGYRSTAQKVLTLLKRTLPPRVAIADTRFLRLAPEESARSPVAEAVAASERLALRSD